MPVDLLRHDRGLVPDQVGNRLDIAVIEDIQIRLHQTVLYNSIYQVDDQLLVNQHAYGIPAAHAPVFTFRKTAGSAIWPLPTLSLRTHLTVRQGISLTSRWVRSAGLSRWLTAREFDSCADAKVH